MKKGFFCSASVVGLVVLSMGMISQDVYGSNQSTPRTTSVIQGEIDALLLQPSSRNTNLRLERLRAELLSAQSGVTTTTIIPSPTLSSSVPVISSSTQPSVQASPSIPKPQKSLADLMRERSAQSGGASSSGPSSSPLPSHSAASSVPSSQQVSGPSAQSGGSVQAPVFLPGLGASAGLSSVPKPVEKSLPDAPKRLNVDDHRGVDFPQACARVVVKGRSEDASAIDPEHPGDYQVIHGWLEQSPVNVSKRVFATSEHLQSRDAIGKITYQISPDVGEIGKGAVDFNRMEFLLQASIEGHIVLAVLDRVGNFVKCVSASTKGIVHGKALTPEQIAHNQDINRQVNEALARGDDAAVQHLIGQLHEEK